MSDNEQEASPKKGDRVEHKLSKRHGTVIDMMPDDMPLVRWDNPTYEGEPASAHPPEMLRVVEASAP